MSTTCYISSFCSEIIRRQSENRTLHAAQTARAHGTLPSSVQQILRSVGLRSRRLHIEDILCYHGTGLQYLNGAADYVGEEREYG